MKEGRKTVKNNAPVEKLDLPEIRIVSVKDMDPQVQMELEMSDETFAMFLDLAMKDISQKDRDCLLVDEIIRRALTETVEKMIKDEAKKEKKPRKKSTKS